jgi:hypothetical protein
VAVIDRFGPPPTDIREPCCRPTTAFVGRRGNPTPAASIFSMQSHPGSVDEPVVEQLNRMSAAGCEESEFVLMLASWRGIRSGVLTLDDSRLNTPETTPRSINHPRDGTPVRLQVLNCIEGWEVPWSE